MNNFILLDPFPLDARGGISRDGEKQAQGLLKNHNDPMPVQRIPSNSAKTGRKALERGTTISDMLGSIL